MHGSAFPNYLDLFLYKGGCPIRDSEVDVDQGFFRSVGVEVVVEQEVVVVVSNGA